MPRTRSLAWAELKIGLVSIFALVMAGLLIFLLSGEGGFFWQRYGIKTVFANVAGLKAGAPVRLAGVEVGSVTEVQFIGDRVEVLMEVSKEMSPRITTASVALLPRIAVERTPSWLVGAILSIMAVAIVAEQGKGSAFIYFQF